MATINIGDTVVEPNNDGCTPQFILGTRVQVPQNCTPKTISLYMGTAGTDLYLGIYSDNNGKPGALLTQSVAIHAVAGWNIAVLQTPVSLTANQYIWLSWSASTEYASGVDGWRYKDGGSSFFYWRPAWVPLDANAYSDPTIVAGTYSIYITADVAGGGNTATFGNTNIESIAYTFNDAVKHTQYTSPSQSGTLRSISLYITGSGGNVLDYWDLNGVNKGSVNPYTFTVEQSMDGQTLTGHFKAGSGTAHARVAIYADVADKPRVLLAISASELITVDGWHEFAMPAIPISANTKYWLAVYCDSPNLRWYANEGGIGPKYCNVGSTYPNFPDPSTGDGASNWLTSVYATIDVGTTSVSVSITSTPILGVKLTLVEVN